MSDDRGSASPRVCGPLEHGRDRQGGGSVRREVEEVSRRATLRHDGRFGSPSNARVLDIDQYVVGQCTPAAPTPNPEQTLRFQKKDTVAVWLLRPQNGRVDSIPVPRLGWSWGFHAPSPRTFQSTVVGVDAGA
jgi:hypothetical protein